MGAHEVTLAGAAGDRGAPLHVDEQQLAGGKPDGVDLGPDQVLWRSEACWNGRGLAGGITTVAYHT